MGTACAKDDADPDADYRKRKGPRQGKKQSPVETAKTAKKGSNVSASDKVKKDSRGSKSSKSSKSSKTAGAKKQKSSAKQTPVSSPNRPALEGEGDDGGDDFSDLRSEAVGAPAIATPAAPLPGEVPRDSPRSEQIEVGVAEPPPPMPPLLSRTLAPSSEAAQSAVVVASTAPTGDQERSSSPLQQPPAPPAPDNPLIAPRMLTATTTEDTGSVSTGLGGHPSSSKLTVSSTTGQRGGGNSSSTMTQQTTDGEEDESRRASTASTLTRKRKTEMTAEELHLHRARKQTRRIQLWVSHAHSGPDAELTEWAERVIDFEIFENQAADDAAIAGAAGNECSELPSSESLTISHDESSRVTSACPSERAP